jgi:tetratricopeptide (TPR) repeat protein
VKRFVCILALIVLALPAWPAKKISVGELEDSLKTMQAEKKSDAEVATALKQVELSEELTRSAMNKLLNEAAGSLTREQLYALEARSALLPPPAEDIPPTPAPDATAQKDILDKAAAYVTNDWSQLPVVTAAKTTLRFQDNMEATAASSGLHGGSQDASIGSAVIEPYQYIHYINSTESLYFSNHGVEKLPEDKTTWGPNGMIALREPVPGLGEVFAEAQSAGSMHWLRWEDVNGKPAAVFSFQVPKKESRFNANVCCFPEVTQAGVVQFTSAAMGAAGAPGGGAGGASGNFQTATNWKNFKVSDLPYHGEIFIDPETGIVVRLNTEAEFKPSDVVHQEDTRVDYGPIQVGNAVAVLPIRAVTLTEVAPNGDSQAAGARTLRRTLFTSEFKGYQGDGAFPPLALPKTATAPPPSAAPNKELTVDGKEVASVNALLTQARKATSEKRYADAESLMLNATQSQPNLILAWVELGRAQLALNKYPEAENDFRKALGFQPGTTQKENAAGFYGASGGPTKNSSFSDSGPSPAAKQDLPPDARGTCYASLGEIYAHEGKVKEAQEAFDNAATVYPSQAAQYRHNEAIVFYQTGHSDEQLAAADQAIALDAARAANYYFKAQALVTKATIDPKTQKMVLPPGCAEAFQKYLQLDPNGPNAADARSILAAAK